MFPITENWGMSEVLSDFKEVFTPAQANEATKQHLAEFDVEPGISPMFCKARPIPHVRVDVVAKELDRLEACAIVKWVKHSRWSTLKMGEQDYVGIIKYL